jgi:hypothetical protein
MVEVKSACPLDAHCYLGLGKVKSRVETIGVPFHLPRDRRRVDALS